MTKEKIKEISNKLVEFARYVEQRAELNEEVADYKYQYYYEQLLEIQDDLSEMQNAWWSTKSNQQHIELTQPNIYSVKSSLHVRTLACKLYFIIVLSRLLLIKFLFYCSTVLALQEQLRRATLVFLWFLLMFCEMFFEILDLGMAGPVDSNNYYIFLKKVTTQVSGLVGLLHSYSFDAFGRVFATLLSLLQEKAVTGTHPRCNI